MSLRHEFMQYRLLPLNSIVHYTVSGFSSYKSKCVIQGSGLKDQKYIGALADRIESSNFSFTLDTLEVDSGNKITPPNRVRAF